MKNELTEKIRESKTSNDEWKEIFIERGYFDEVIEEGKEIWLRPLGDKAELRYLVFGQLENGYRLLVADIDDTKEIIDEILEFN